jgi:hypothetical protein
MYAIYGNIYHQYTPNVSIYTIHGSYGNNQRIFSVVKSDFLVSFNHGFFIDREVPCVSLI